LTDLQQLGSSRPVALVTGGARRVGAAICNELAGAGMDILLTHHSRGAHAGAVVEELRAAGRLGAAATLPLDLSDLESVELFCQHLHTELPRLDVLVHNASRYVRTPVSELSAQELSQHQRVNALAPAILSSRLAPMLSSSPLPGGGAIVAMCDLHAMGRPRLDYLAYAMSKSALVEMVRSLARELAPEVRVSGLAPGVVAFPETGPDAEPDAQSRYLARVPLARSGTPQEAARAVRWLALEATYLTGEIIRMDGGRWLV